MPLELTCCTISAHWSAKEALKGNHIYRPCRVQAWVGDIKQFHISKKGPACLLLVPCHSAPYTSYSQLQKTHLPSHNPSSLCFLIIYTVPVCSLCGITHPDSVTVLHGILAPVLSANMTYITWLLLLWCKLAPPKADGLLPQTNLLCSFGAQTLAVLGAQQLTHWAVKSLVDWPSQLGPHALLASCFVRFVSDIPVLQHFKILGFPLSDKVSTLACCALVLLYKMPGFLSGRPGNAELCRKSTVSPKLHWK